jgi:hypothetical protein
MTATRNIFSNGIRELELPSWEDFCQTVPTFTSKRGYVWRGQQRDECSGWDLRSSFDRAVTTKDQNDRTIKLQDHLHRFKQRMNLLFPNVLPPDDVDIWALGQHYGLKSPLLDWSTCPFIAAYFAFIAGSDPTDKSDTHRYVYGLNRSIERLMTKQKKAAALISSDRSVPFIDQLQNPSPRFNAQKGIFTKAFQGNDINQYVDTLARKRPNEQVIIKIRIPTSERDEFLRQLHLTNMDHTTLLLDLREAVDYCNAQL